MAGDYNDTLGVYASTTDGKKVTLVIVNKDTSPVNLGISNIPAGTYFMRHFGGDAGVAKWQVSCHPVRKDQTGTKARMQTTIKIAANSNLVLPAYTAVFLQQQ